MSKCFGKPETINEFGRLEVECSLVHLERPSKLRIFVPGTKRRNSMNKRRIYLKYVCPKLNRLCQGCRSLSRKERCPVCTSTRWIYFDCALGMTVWVHTFTALQSALTPTARYAVSANPRTETT